MNESSTNASSAGQPHLIFISDDEHRYDWTGFDGGPVRTPRLEALAERGVRYTRCYSPNPLCMPARCMLHNGLYSHQSGQMNNIGRWPDLPTLPQALQRAGYHTAAIGKLHHDEAIPQKTDIATLAESAKAMGYDHVHEVGGKSMAWFTHCNWSHHLEKHGLYERYLEDAEARQSSPGADSHPFVLPTEHYNDIYTTNRILEYLDAYDAESPMYLWAGLCSPHGPFDAPREYFDRYPPGSLPDPIDFDPNGPVSLDTCRRMRRLYAGMIELVDEQVGRILDKLESKGMLDNAIVVFVSDHGEMLGDHNLWAKVWPHDPSSRVPCIVSDYRRDCRGVSDALIEITDLVATLLHAGTGREDPASALPGTPARSLLDHLETPNQPFRDHVFLESGYQFVPGHMTIRDDRYKYTRYDHRAASRDTLFDMHEDPDECVNLCDDPSLKPVKSRLQVALLDTLHHTPAVKTSCI